MHQAYLHKTERVVNIVQAPFFPFPSTRLLPGLAASPFSRQGLGIRVVSTLQIMCRGNCRLKGLENEITTGSLNLEQRKGLHSLILCHVVTCRGGTLKDHLTVSIDFSDLGVISIASNIL